MHGLTGRFLRRLLPFTVQGRGVRGLGLLSVQMPVEMGEEWINVHFRDKINLAGFADGIKGDYDGGRKSRIYSEFLYWSTG